MRLYHKIDLRHGATSPKYVARLIWQVLFKKYQKYGDMDNLDSMLCDLYTLERFILVGQNSFFWNCDGQITDLQTWDISFGEESTVKVEIVASEIFFYESTIKGKTIVQRFRAILQGAYSRCIRIPIRQKVGL